MRELSFLLRIGLLVLLVAGGLWLTAIVGLALFRRTYAQRTAAIAAVPEVELAFGAPWTLFANTVAFAIRHPSTLRWGLVYALHLLIGIDLLDAISDADLERLHRDIERNE
jgi:hypothetical protein